MTNIKLLDCTLRDGGYINDWNFGSHTINDIMTNWWSGRGLCGSRVSSGL